MSDQAENQGDLWGEEDGDPTPPDAQLILNLDGFEGPLDLLLALARTQKLDLSQISMLDLARQYLAYIETAQTMRLEVAADYLVMAAWLAFLKSKLLLPREEGPGTEPSGEELAALLAFRLKRLDAMRDAAAKLMSRKRLGIAIFARGMPQPVRLKRHLHYSASLYDLLKAYSDQRVRTVSATVTIALRPVWSIKQARRRLEELFGVACGWSALDSYLQEYVSDAQTRRTVTASTFGATLEMAREGKLELRQAQAFAPIFLRRRSDKEDEPRTMPQPGESTKNFEASE